MKDTSAHINLINNLLKNIKSTLHAEYVQPCSEDISIATNNVVSD